MRRQIYGDDKLILYLHKIEDGYAWSLVVKGQRGENHINGQAASLNIATDQAHKAAGELGYPPDHPIEQGVITESDPNWEPPASL